MNKHLFACTILTAAIVASGCSKTETPSAPAQPPAAPATTNSNAALPPGHPPINPGQQPALPPGHPPMDMSQQMLPPGSVADAAAPKWDVPKDWQAGRPSSMRKGSFMVKGEEGVAADIAVTVFPGDVGGMLSNINRWRGQIGLAPAMPDEVATMTSNIEVAGQKCTVVDIVSEKAPEGAKNPVRMIVVTVPREGNSWFFKMTGDAKLVEGQKDAFLGFVKSAKF